jgi:hypothetical protein
VHPATKPPHIRLAANIVPTNASHELQTDCHGAGKAKVFAPVTNKPFTFVQLCTDVVAQPWRRLITFWHLEGWFCTLFSVDNTAPPQTASGVNNARPRTQSGRLYRPRKF